MVETFEERLVHPAARGLSWGAVFGGFAVALVTELLLSLLGIGIGASTIHPTSSSGASAQSVGIGSVVWFVLASILSLFAGGWVAGRLSGNPRRPEGALHGIITWSLTSLMTVFLLTTAVGGIISGATGALGSLFSAAGAGVAAAAPDISKAAGNELAKSGVSSNDITAKAAQLLRETGNPNLSPGALEAQGTHAANSAKNAAYDPANTSANFNRIVGRFMHDTGAASQASDRRALINVVASEQHITKAQAARTVEAWSRQMKQTQAQTQTVVAQTQQKVKEAGDQTASAVSKAALSAFLLFVLGAVAAAIGGIAGAGSIGTDLRQTEKINTSGGTVIRETRTRQSV